MRCAVVLTCLVVIGFGSAMAGELEPSAPPGPTMKSFDEIAPTWSQTLDSTNSDADGCNSDRFKCVLNDEAVLDMETGLVWQRSPENLIVDVWANQFVGCFLRSTGNRGGWRMPTAEEFLSLVDHSPGTNQALPASHPFTDILEMACYFSATTKVSDPTQVHGFGCAGANGSSGCGLCAMTVVQRDRIWCVRGGYGDVAP